jgi:hypothetical protein
LSRQRWHCYLDLGGSTNIFFTKTLYWKNGD